MLDITIAIVLAVAVGIASFVYRKRSPTYMQLTLLLGATAVMFMTAITEPELRWIGMVFTLLGCTGAYRVYGRLRAEQA